MSRASGCWCSRDSDEARAITARALLAAGLKAEQEKKWKTALESLSDASHLIAPTLKPVQRYRDPTYLVSLNAAAVAYMNLKQNQRAGELFADDAPLGRAALAMNSPSRDLVWNRAVNDLTQKFNIMRSVKMLHDYMDLHKEPDEPLLNLLGTVLFVADETAPANRKVLDDAIGFYSQPQHGSGEDPPRAAALGNPVAPRCRGAGEIRRVQQVARCVSGSASRQDRRRHARQGHPGCTACAMAVPRPPK